jgi:hypothetical protein
LGGSSAKAGEVVIPRPIKSAEDKDIAKEDFMAQSPLQFNRQSIPRPNVNGRMKAINRQLENLVSRAISRESRKDAKETFLTTVIILEQGMRRARNGKPSAPRARNDESSMRRAK